MFIYNYCNIVHKEYLNLLSIDIPDHLHPLVSWLMQSLPELCSVVDDDDDDSDNDDDNYDDMNVTRLKNDIDDLYSRV